MKCFIENDLEVSDFDAEYFQDKTGVPFAEYFDAIVVDAASHKHEVWKAINTCDEIWLSTSYVGDSGRLLTEMLQMAKQNNITNKTVINTHEYMDVAWHLDDEQRNAMWELADSNNIKFIYKDSYPEFSDKLKEIRQKFNS